jgi:hypothetical protein
MNLLIHPLLFFHENVAILALLSVGVLPSQQPNQFGGMPTLI